MAHSDLKNAKKAKNDEFYTQLVDIEKELKHYKEHLKDKVVFCNCDDPYESNFFKYFALNFNFLGLKKLICTSYDTSPVAYTQLALFDDLEKTYLNNNRKAYKIEITEVDDYNGDGAYDLSDVEYLLKNKKNSLSLLKGNGDFRGEECVELLKEADIVVTNPPFSLFREYLAQLVEYNKKFIIIGNPNAITYKEVFPLIQKDQLWIGYKSMGTDMLFDVSKEYAQTLLKTKKEGSGYKIIDGVVKGRAQAIWYTNLDTNKRHEELTLYKQYSPEEYSKYDNYDAINVDKVSEIPYDYDGYIGVPITFLDKYCPEQFEIIGQGQGNLYRELTPKGLSQKFVDDYYKFGGKGSIKEDHPVLAYYDKEGKPVIPYMRIIIRRKTNEN